MPRLRRLGADGFQARARHRPARRDVLRAVDVPHRARRRRTTASSATAGTSATSARSSSGASTTRSCRARRCGRRRGAPKPGLPRRERLLVVRDGRDDRPHGHAAADLLRRRQEGARLLHGSARAARPADRRARRVPALHTTGARPRASRRRAGSRRPRASCSTRSELDLLLVYLPHLDYDHQRFGPGAAEAAAAAARARRRRRRPGRARARAAATPSSCSPSTGSPTRAGRSTSTARCAAPGCSRSTRRRAWSTSTRGRRARSRSPTTRSRTST